MSLVTELLNSLPKQKEQLKTELQGMFSRDQKDRDIRKIMERFTLQLSTNINDICTTMADAVLSLSEVEKIIVTAQSYWRDAIQETIDSLANANSEIKMLDVGIILARLNQLDLWKNVIAKVSPENINAATGIVASHQVAWPSDTSKIPSNDFAVEDLLDLLKQLQEDSGNYAENAHMVQYIVEQIVLIKEVYAEHFSDFIDRFSKFYWQACDDAVLAIVLKAISDLKKIAKERGILANTLSEKFDKLIKQVTFWQGCQQFVAVLEEFDHHVVRRIGKRVGRLAEPGAMRALLHSTFQQEIIPSLQTATKLLKAHNSDLTSRPWSHIVMQWKGIMCALMEKLFGLYGKKLPLNAVLEFVTFQQNLSCLSDYQGLFASSDNGFANDVAYFMPLPIQLGDMRFSVDNVDELVNQICILLSDFDVLFTNAALVEKLLNRLNSILIRSKMNHGKIADLLSPIIIATPLNPLGLTQDTKRIYQQVYAIVEEHLSDDDFEAGFQADIVSRQLMLISCWRDNDNFVHRFFDDQPLENIIKYVQLIWERYSLRHHVTSASETRVDHSQIDDENAIACYELLQDILAIRPLAGEIEPRNKPTIARELTSLINAFATNKGSCGRMVQHIRSVNTVSFGQAGDNVFDHALACIPEDLALQCPQNNDEYTAALFDLYTANFAVIPVHVGVVLLLAECVLNTRVIAEHRSTPLTSFITKLAIKLMTLPEDKRQVLLFEVMPRMDPQCAGLLFAANKELDVFVMSVDELRSLRLQHCRDLSLFIALLRNNAVTPVDVANALTRDKNDSRGKNLRILVAENPAAEGLSQYLMRNITSPVCPTDKRREILQALPAGWLTEFASRIPNDITATTMVSLLHACAYDNKVFEEMLREYQQRVRLLPVIAVPITASLTYFFEGLREFPAALAAAMNLFDWKSKEVLVSEVAALIYAAPRVTTISLLRGKISAEVIRNLFCPTQQTQQGQLLALLNLPRPESRMRLVSDSIYSLGTYYTDDVLARFRECLLACADDSALVEYIISSVPVDYLLAYCIKPGLSATVTALLYTTYLEPQIKQLISQYHQLLSDNIVLRQREPLTYQLNLGYRSNEKRSEQIAELVQMILQFIIEHCADCFAILSSITRDSRFLQFLTLNELVIILNEPLSVGPGYVTRQDKEDFVGNAGLYTRFAIAAWLQKLSIVPDTSSKRSSGINDPELQLTVIRRILRFATHLNADVKLTSLQQVVSLWQDQQATSMLLIALARYRGSDQSGGISRGFFGKATQLIDTDEIEITIRHMLSEKDVLQILGFSWLQDEEKCELIRRYFCVKDFFTSRFIVALWCTPGMNMSNRVKQQLVNVASDDTGLLPLFNRQRSGIPELRALSVEHARWCLMGVALALLNKYKAGSVVRLNPAAVEAVLQYLGSPQPDPLVAEHLTSKRAKPLSVEQFYYYLSVRENTNEAVVSMLMPPLTATECCDLLLNENCRFSPEELRLFTMRVLEVTGYQHVHQLQALARKHVDLRDKRLKSSGAVLPRNAEQRQYEVLLGRLWVGLQKRDDKLEMVPLSGADYHALQAGSQVLNKNTGHVATALPSAHAVAHEGTWYVTAEWHTVMRELTQAEERAQPKLIAERGHRSLSASSSTVSSIDTDDSSSDDDDSTPSDTSSESTTSDSPGASTTASN